MAIVKDNILLQLVNGSLGDIITIYVRNGQIIMAKKRGPSTKAPTSKQLTARFKMKLAVAMAREMLKDPKVKAYYASKAGPGQNAFNMAVKAAFEMRTIKEAEAPKKTTPPRKGRVADQVEKPLFLPEEPLHELTQFREIG